MIKNGYQSNMLRIILTLSSMMSALFVSGNSGLIECGILSIETPTILGRDVTFSFTLDTYDPNATLTWQRKRINTTTWYTLNLSHRFTQYQYNNTFYLELTNSDKHDGQQDYRVNYSNDKTQCLTETITLDLEAQMSMENEIYDQTGSNIGYILNIFLFTIILGSIILATGIIITAVIFVVIRKRRQNPKEKKENRVKYRATVGNVRNQDNPVYDLQECQNEAEHSHEIADEEPAYSQPLKPRKRENKDNIYSNVIDATTSAQQRHAEDGKLFYADLDFDPNETPSEGGEPSTEYTDIDFVKTQTQKDITNTLLEQEQIRFRSEEI